MKQTRSLFRRFLKGHFIFIFFPPIMLIFFFAFTGFSINGENLNTSNQFYVILLLFGFIIVAFVVK